MTIFSWFKDWHGHSRSQHDAFFQIHRDSLVFAAMLSFKSTTTV
jgi:hypothetical protein